MNTFELNPEPQPPSGSRICADTLGLGTSVLVFNARWFTRVRWLVVTLFVATAVISSLFPQCLGFFGFVAPARWPWYLAAILGAANVVFTILVWRLTEDSSRAPVVASLWLQIGLDLMVVTVVVHYVGSTRTFIAFAYLLHIVLACIFFPKKYSFLVTLLASVLYVACVGLETSGVLAARSMVAYVQPAESQAVPFRLIVAASAVVLWSVVWYFSSALSETVQRHELELSRANEQLRVADREKNREVLRTAHDLKAPFAGIQSNTEVLKLLYWDDLPDHVKPIITRIEGRTMALQEKIQDILTLGHLRSEDAAEDRIESVDLQAVIHDVVSDLRERIKERRIALDIRVPELTVDSNQKQLTTLFSNLIANAVLYSHEGGRLDIVAAANPEEVSVAVSDHGIGIREEALPSIFDEYFRTQEAARFNKLSTGLGLAIVRRIAENLGLRIRVTSQLGKGTTFEVFITETTRQKGE